MTFRVNLLTTTKGDLDLLGTIGPELEYADLLDRWSTTSASYWSARST